MIEELTKENLQNLGYNEKDVNDLYNIIDTCILNCDIGNIFVSKPENKFYTGIDFYRKTCLNKGSLHFPYSCPDLLYEYFDLALFEFLEKQKNVLGLLYNENDQFNNFLLKEIEINKQRIDSQKEFLLKAKNINIKFKSKENEIQICESYINYLKEKQQSEADKPFEKLLENERIDIFKNDFGFTLFTKMFDLYKKENTHLANFSFLFYAMEKDFLVCSQIEFIKFLESKKYNIIIEKIDSRQSGTNKKTNLYNSIKQQLQVKHK